MQADFNFIDSRLRTTSVIIATIDTQLGVEQLNHRAHPQLSPDPFLTFQSDADSEKPAENSDSDRKDRDESVNIEDLSGIHDDSDRDQSDEDSPGSEGDVVGGLVDAMKVTKRRNKRRSSENATNLAKKLRSTSVDEIGIPAEPEGRCSTALQDKIKRFMERKVKDGEDLNRAIQSRKDFRNPSIYEKLIVYLGIDELGTNFPKEDYNPKTWRKAPAYDELARAQREDMAKRERERKTKVEFVTGTAKKPAAASAAAASEAAKKSKWDQQALGRGQDKASGHKATVIPAVGSIKKAKA